jgi:hypothetical protein
MKTSEAGAHLRIRLALIAAFITAVLALAAVPRAQQVWNDLRHEVTLRNDPQSFTCSVVNSSATILTALGGSCTTAALAAGQSLYITDITASASAIATVTADQYLELKSGIGTVCGTNTAVIWSAYHLAFAPIVATFTTPIKVGANVDLCWMDAVVGSKTFIVNGYIK